MIQPYFLLNPGNKFTVPDDVPLTNVTSNTVLFGSSIVNMSPSGIVVDFVITRSGKRGKDRLSKHNATIPYGNYVFELGLTGYTPINIEQIPENILELKDMDFLGWSYAVVSFLRFIDSNYNPEKYRIWPGSNTDPLNVCLSFNSRFENDPTKVKENYTTDDFKKLLLTSVRYTESLLISNIMIYKYNMATNFLSYINNLLSNFSFTLPEEKKDRCKKELYLLRNILLGIKNEMSLKPNRLSKKGIDHVL